MISSSVNLRSHIRLGCVGCYQYANLILRLYGRAKYGILYTRTRGDCKYLEVARIMHQSIPAVPRPPPVLLWGICPPCRSQGWGICKLCTAQGPGICQPQGYSQAFDTHAVSYQNITTQRILLEKQAYWLFCQGQEKIEEGCKGIFSIFCMHFFIAYQARIT